MKERLLTIFLSAVTTFVLMHVVQSPRRDSPTALAEETRQVMPELVVDRLIVRSELIVSDTEKPWEDGFEKQQIARGVVARSLGTGTAGVWVRSRLIKTEIDDPFDDRFHAIEHDGSVRGNPGHISWNVWLADNWRQIAILQGEMLERSELAGQQLSGANHPGRLRFQSFRRDHDEPVTDALIGQGMMSLGGGGYGGGGLPFPSEVLQLWGGKMQQFRLSRPQAPRVTKQDNSGKHSYALIAMGAQGDRSEPSPEVIADGLASLAWQSVNGADAYIVLRDGKAIGPMRIEGSEKRWTDMP